MATPVRKKTYIEPKIGGTITFTDEGAKPGKVAGTVTSILNGYCNFKSVDGENGRFLIAYLDGFNRQFSWNGKDESCLSRVQVLFYDDCLA